MTPFSDSDAIAVTVDTARRFGLETLDDLVDNLSPEGSPSSARGPRGSGARGELRDHGCKFVPFAGISPYEALDSNNVLAAAIFSTDPPLNSGKYVVLEDTKAQFGFQNVAPVIDQELADQGGEELAAVFDSVSELLTERAIITMNAAVALEQQSPDAVAKAFLEANGPPCRTRGGAEARPPPSRTIPPVGEATFPDYFRLPPPVAELIGFEFVYARDGSSRMELDVTGRHANPMGTVHGGILCDLADAAMGTAYASQLGTGRASRPWS